MDKFWEWMVSKNWADKYNNLNGLGIKNPVYFEPIQANEQMLIGYMMEYLHEMQKVYKMDTFATINENYLRLEDFINKMFSTEKINELEAKR
jgi:hypothetical protein